MLRPGIDLLLTRKVPGPWDAVMQLAFIKANHHCERDAAVGRLMRLCDRLKDTSTVEVVLLLAAGSSYFFLTRFKLASRGSDGRQSVRQAT